MREIGFSVEDAVVKRYSVRTYDGQILEDALKKKLLSYAAGLENPLGPKSRIQVVGKDAGGGALAAQSNSDAERVPADPHAAGGSSAKGEKLGTYGFIKGAKTYLAVIMPKEPYAQEALGYEFEQLVLYAASLGLGTCWLGGTFDRSAFASRLDIGDGEVFAILSPVGYPSQKRRIFEKIMRGAIKADARKPWHEMFFKERFGVPLTEADAGVYRFPLDMVRLAPSAVNRQPWRIVMTDGAFHFFEKRAAGKENERENNMEQGKALNQDPGKDHGVDMHRIDLGIAICHFHLAALEKGLEGRFERNYPDIDVPAGTDYIASWVML